MGELKLMKGNEAVAEAAIRAGVDAYFGYPITPQSEVMEYLAAEQPHKRTGMVLLQAESEIAAINMVYGAASTGKKAMTSSSSPGISLKMEGISYLAGAELPCVVVNVVRGGPGLGTIQPSQADYFQATKGGGHGDYHMLVLAPASVQEMSDFVKLGFDLAFKYRNPVMILSDGVIGQMMEKVELFDPIPRCTEFNEEWMLTGKTADREKRVVTSLDLDSAKMEKHNLDLVAKYKKMQENEVRYEEFQVEDAEYLFVAYGCSARICQKTVKIAREMGHKVGLLRPITLYPYPSKRLNELADRLKGILSVELNSGQMIEDVKLAVNGKTKVEHYGRMGGMIHSPEQVLCAFEEFLLK
ncbi:MAG: 3-methyl-2-oxobutanoate dehydrogenase subunit VorB [Bacteroidales bacterium]|nr:3-methyl-2-oxobutanoate dehydrogenase subunit VorB [Bacteroidales bacterium]MBN2819575.1 3-methyl-2-oxobutanoate dehydrogenase subunit VorB [Bacteroidales bacterium]